MKLLKSTHEEGVQVIDKINFLGGRQVAYYAEVLSMDTLMPLTGNL